MISET
jgi:hypothetical protein